MYSSTNYVDIVTERKKLIVLCRTWMRVPTDRETP